MSIPYYRHSGRRKHYWRVRNEGLRDLLIQHRWYLKGGYCEKSIRGRSIMQTMVSKNDDYCVVCVCDKYDFWADVTAKARAAEALGRRGAFAVVMPDSADGVVAASSPTSATEPLLSQPYCDSLARHTAGAASSEAVRESMMSEVVERVMKNHPGLTAQKAREMIEAFGG